MTKNSSSKSNDRIYVNREIRASEVRCLDKNSENIGIVSTEKAIKMAEGDGLDLIQISSPNNGIPICKITDYGKYKFDLSKKNKKHARKQRESIVKQKEIKFRPNTGINDLQTKAKMASKFINEGCRVRVSIKFKGREIDHRYIAENRFNEFLDCMNVDVNVINEPKTDGKTMVALLTAHKKMRVIEKAS